MDEKPKHTPGKWRVRYDKYVEGGEEYKIFYITPEYAKMQIASMPFSDFAEANAKLIALSPELLECLKDVINNLSCGNTNGFFGECKYFKKESLTCSKKGMCMAKKWLTIIRKAEGIE